MKFLLVYMTFLLTLLAAFILRGADYDKIEKYEAGVILSTPLFWAAIALLQGWIQ